MRRRLVAVTLVLGALAALYGALIVLDLLSRTTERSQRPLAVGTELSVSTSSGAVTVVAGSGPARLELRTVGGLFGASEVQVERGAGGRVSVTAECPSFTIVSCSADLRLVVPARTAVRADTGSGEVTVRGMHDGVEAETGSGEITVADVAGARVVADTGSGDVRATGLRVEELRADTGSGEVVAEHLAPPRDVEVDTGSGDVDLRLPDAGYAIETDTGSGDERVEVRRDDAAPRRVRIDTGSGDVTVRPAR